MQIIQQAFSHSSSSLLMGKMMGTIVDLIGIVFFLFPLLYIIWVFSYPFVYKSWQMNEISREAGGLSMLYLLKFAILLFVILLFLQAISKIINYLLYIFRNDS